MQSFKRGYSVENLHVRITLGLLLASTAVILVLLRGNVVLHFLLIAELISSSLLVPLGLFLVRKGFELGR